MLAQHCSFRLGIWQLTLAAALFVPVRARACGASAGGVAGISACSLSEHNEAERDKWRVGAGLVFTDTAIRFDDDARFDQTRSAGLLTLDYAPTPRWTLQFGAGAFFDGSIDRAGEHYDLAPGLVALAGASFRLLDAEGLRPFVLLSGQLAYLTTRTRSNGAGGASSMAYNAFDLRIGPTVGWTFWRSVSLYALARAFGGPIYWHHQGQSVVGQDTHHYQIGAGASALFARRVDLFVEGSALGERAVSAGAGFAF